MNLLVALWEMVGKPLYEGLPKIDQSGWTPEQKQALSRMMQATEDLRSKAGIEKPTTPTKENT